MTRECDLCQMPIDRRASLVEIRTIRPSDPSDLCCILWSCRGCTPESHTSVTGGSATAAEWDDFIESDEARASGLCFLS